MKHIERERERVATVREKGIGRSNGEWEGVILVGGSMKCNMYL